MVPPHRCPLGCVLAHPPAPPADVVLDVVDRGLTRGGYPWTTIRTYPAGRWLPLLDMPVDLLLKGTAIRG